MNNLENVLILKKGGIHIKKKNIGSFTKYCKGKVTEECIRRGKNSPNSKIRKKATFAANSRRWKHENGGILKYQNPALPLQPAPLSPVGIALNQARAMAKSKPAHLPPGVKEVVGPDGKKVAIRTEQPLVPLEQSVAEWLPGTGDAAEVGQIGKDLKEGNVGSAVLGAGLFLLPGNAGKLLKTNVGTKVSNFLDKNLFNYDELWAKIKHPTWKKYYHGSPNPFPIKKADMGRTGADMGLHMTDDRKVAEHFANDWHPDSQPTVYEFFAPKPTIETVDIGANNHRLFTGEVEWKAGGIHDSSYSNTLWEGLLKKYGGDDVIIDVPISVEDRKTLDFMYPGTGAKAKKYELKRDVTIPLKDEFGKNLPDQVREKIRQINPHVDAKIVNREVAKILSDSGHKVLQYENVYPREGLKTSFVLLDPSNIQLINPEHQFKMKHALTGLGAGLGIGYGVSQIKDE